MSHIISTLFSTLLNFVAFKNHSIFNFHSESNELQGKGTEPSDEVLYRIKFH